MTSTGRTTNRWVYDELQNAIQAGHKLVHSHTYPREVPVATSRLVLRYLEEVDRVKPLRGTINDLSVFALFHY